MVHVEEVLIWFKDLNHSVRIEAVCGLLEMCTPFELRFFSILLENYGKRDFHLLCLKEAEQKLNTEIEILKLTNLSDPVVRSNLIISLILIESSNRLCASRIFKLLVDELQTDKLTSMIHSDEKCANDVLLMLTLATHHPAFSFQQQSKLSQKLLKLKETLGASLPTQDYDMYNTIWSFPTLTPPPTDVDVLPVIAMNSSLPVNASTYLWSQDLHSTQAQVSSLELIGVEKNRSYRIKILWSNGKSYEVTKCYNEILNFHQKVFQTQNPVVGNPDNIVPFLPPLINNGGDEIIDSHFVQMAEYFRKLTINIPMLNHDIILTFLNEKAITPPPLAGVNLIPSYQEDVHRLRSPAGHNTFSQHSQFPLTNSASDITIVETTNQSNVGDSRPSSRPLALQSSSSPPVSPLSSPVSSPYVSPPASGTSSRSASPWQQQPLASNTSGSYQQGSYNRVNTSMPRALRSKSSNPKNGGSSSSSSSSGYGNNSQVSRTNNSKLQGMSTDEIENVGLMKGAAGKLKKVLDTMGNNPPNGANIYHNHHNHPCVQNHITSVSSSHNNSGAAPSSQMPSTFNFSPTSRQRSESSPSCSEYSSPPPSPPLLDGIQGQNVQLHSQTSSSSEENLATDQSTSIKTDLSKTPTNMVNSATTSIITTPNYGITVVNNPIGSSYLSRHNGLAETQPSIVTTAPMIHPFKPNSLPLHQCRTSVGAHFGGMNPILFDGRLHPAIQVMGGPCNTSVPPPGIPRPAHISPGVPLPSNQDRMMPFAPVLSTGPCSSVPLPSRNLSAMRNNITTVTSMHGHSHSNSHRYTPPKGHIMQNSMDKTCQSQQSNTHPPMHEVVPYMIFTQPPPPVPSSSVGNIMPLHITNCLSNNCNCTMSVSSSLGSLMSPPSAPPNQQGSVVASPTNGGGAPVAVTVPYPSYMHVFPPHTLQFMTTHSGSAGANNFISTTLPTHFSYAIPNGMSVSNGGGSQNVSHELLYTAPAFHLIAPPGTPNGGSNLLTSAPNVQQGSLPPGAAIVPAFPGVCPFPQTNPTMKVATCYNCGMPGHRGPDCKENTADDIVKSS